MPYQIRHTGMRTNTYRYCCHGKSGNSKWSVIFEKSTRAQHGHKFSFQLEFGDIGANSWSPSQTWNTKLSTHSNAFPSRCELIFLTPPFLSRHNNLAKSTCWTSAENWKHVQGAFSSAIFKPLAFTLWRESVIAKNCTFWRLPSTTFSSFQNYLAVRLLMNP